MKKDRKSLKNNCAFIMQFAMDDFKTKYAGSVLGFFGRLYSRLLQW